MRGNQQRLMWLGVSILAVLIAAPSLFCQTAAEAGSPVITDWSSRHVIFSRPATKEQARRIENDPRYRQQLGRSQAPPMAAAMQKRASELQAAADAAQVSASEELSEIFPIENLLQHDWQEDLGSGGSVGAGNFPAKYGFHGNTANCGNATQPDFVVYSTGIAGSTGQASVVAYDNLYSGCT